MSGVVPDGKVHISTKLRLAWGACPLSETKLPQDVVAQLCANGMSTRGDLIYALQEYGYTRTTAKVHVRNLCNQNGLATPRALAVVEILRGESADGHLHKNMYAKNRSKPKLLSASKISPAMVSDLGKSGYTTQESLVTVLVAQGYKASSAKTLVHLFCAAGTLSKKVVGIIRDLIDNPAPTTPASCGSAGSMARDPQP